MDARLIVAKPAIDFVLSNEGGFEDDPKDSGGATNRGISLRFLRGLPIGALKKYGIFTSPELLNVNDIKNLSLDQTYAIYFGEFWDKTPFDQIQNSVIREYVFDMCVNHGIAQGIKILQRAIWAANSYYKYQNLADDGILGDLTLHLVNTASIYPLAAALCAERAGFMRLLAVINLRDGEFLHGWLARCYRI